MLGWLISIATKASFVDWALLLSSLGGLLYWLGTRTHHYFQRRGMPFLRPLPFLGNAASVLLGRDSLFGFAADLYKRSEGHRAMGFFRGMQPTLLIRDPELIKMVTVKEFDHFVNRQSLFSEEVEPILARNLLILKDQEWRDMRATLSPSFTASKMRNILGLMNCCTEQMSTYIQEQTKASQDGVFEAEMKDFFTRFTNDVIATSAFGIQCDSMKQPENQFYKMGRLLTNNTGIRAAKFLGYLIIPKVMQTLRVALVPNYVKSYFNRVVHDTIKERRNLGIYRPDMLQLLMQLQDGQLKAESQDDAENIQGAKKIKLTDFDLTAQAVIFFIAGFATVSTTMSFCVYTLAKHPNIQERLQREVDDVFEKYDGKLSYEAIQELKYTEMVIYEILRMNPVLPILNRQCTKDFVIPAHGNTPAYKVNQGDVVWIPTIGLHRDPKYWDNPDTFDPERFSEENKDKIVPYTFHPFGLGPRICIGNRFALMEVKTGLAHLLRNFNFSETSKTPKKPEHDPRDLTGNIKGGFWLGITQRTQ